MTSEKTQRLRASSEANSRGFQPGEFQASELSASPVEHWRAVLGGLSPREVLARLLQGDPLELRRVVAARLAERAYLFDADRVHLRALAHCARRAVRYRGTPPIEVWLTELVDQALLDLLREDAQAQRLGSAPEAEELAAFVELARPLGLEPAAMRRVCLAHNLLPESERQAFHGLVIARRELESLARELGVSGVEVARRARRGLEAVLIAAGQMQQSQLTELAPGLPANEALQETTSHSIADDHGAPRANVELEIQPAQEEVQP